MEPVALRVLVANRANLSASSAETLAAVRKVTARFKGLAAVEAVALDDPSVAPLGISLEPTVLVEDLIVSVGQAPDAGYLVRAIKHALAQRCNCADGECCP